MFHGRAKLNLDSKGRLAIPAKYREALLAQCAGQLVVTADSSQYLLVYPKPEWEALKERVMRLPNANPNVRQLQRYLVGMAEAVELDGAGRILITPELREFAGLDKNVTLVGLGAKFELWDEAKWETQMSAPLRIEEISAELEGFSW